MQVKIIMHSRRLVQEKRKNQNGVRSAKMSGKSKSSSKNEAGLWERIRNKRARIKAGSGEKMRKPGSKGAPTAAAFKAAAKTTKKKSKPKPKKRTA
jgi:cysteine sulfinate desulfinase/cysteine desulfurase-like protein